MIYPVLLLGYAILWLASRQLQISSGRGGTIWKNPYSWFVAAWVVQAVLMSLPLLVYETQETAETAIYVMTAHAAFVLGIFAAIAASRVPKPVSFRKPRRSIFQMLVAIGMTGQLAVTAGNLFRPDVTVADRLTAEGFERARNMAFEADMSLLGPLFGPLSAAAAVSFVAIAYFGFYWGLGARWTRRPSPETLLISALVLLYLFDNMFLSGARFGIVLAGVSFGGPALLARSLRPAPSKPSARKPLRIAIWSLVIALLAAGSVLFQQYRGNDADASFIMDYAVGAEPHPSVAETVRQSQFAGYGLVQATYFASSTNLLDFYLDLRDFPGPFYGRYNFPVLYRTFFRPLPSYNPDFWSEDRIDLFEPLESKGRHGNVWASLVRDLIADFGKIGALLALVLLGWSVQRATDSFYSRPDPYRAALVAFLWLVCLWSAFHSLLFITNVSWALLLLTGIVVVQSFRPAARSIGGPRRGGPATATRDAPQSQMEGVRRLTPRPRP